MRAVYLAWVSMPRIAVRFPSWSARWHAEPVRSGNWGRVPSNDRIVISSGGREVKRRRAGSLWRFELEHEGVMILDVGLGRITLETTLPSEGVRLNLLGP